VPKTVIGFPQQYCGKSFMTEPRLHIDLGSRRSMHLCIIVGCVNGHLAVLCKNWFYVRIPSIGPMDVICYNQEITCTSRHRPSCRTLSSKRGNLGLVSEAYYI